MEIRVVPAADKAKIDLIRRRLEEAGHTVTVGLNDVSAAPSKNTESARANSTEATGLVIAVADSDIDPASVVRLWTELTEAERQGLPILAAKTSESDLPAAITALPHTGQWIYVQPIEGVGYAELLGAVTALSHGPDANAHAKSAQPALVLAKIRSRAEHIRYRLPRHGSEPAAANETARRSRVFVAYSREDHVIVDAICSRLDREGYDVWRDTKSIPGGAQWRDEIAAAISEVDFVLVLLSSNVTKKPRYPKVEVHIADSHQKKIIPILLEDIPLPPKGFEYTLAGLECVALYRNFDDGIHELFVALGQDTRKRKKGARDRAADALAETISTARRKELGKKAKTVVVVGLGAATTALAVALARDEEEAKKEQARRKRDYRDKVAERIRSVVQEVVLTKGMTPQEYRREFRPKVAKALGQLEATEPPTSEIAAAHAKVVNDLDNVIRNFDEAINELERGDSAAWTRAIYRLNDSWATGLGSSVDLLMQASFIGDEKPHDPSGNDLASTA